MGERDLNIALKNGRLFVWKNRRDAKVKIERSFQSHGNTHSNGCEDAFPKYRTQRRGIEYNTGETNGKIRESRSTF